MKYKSSNRFFPSILFVIMISVMLVYFFVGEFELPKENDYRGSDSFELTNWQQVHSDGTLTDVSFPQDLQEEDGKVVIQTTLPHINTSKMWIMFWNQGRDLDIYVNDEPRYSYNTDNSRAFGQHSPFTYILHELGENDGGAVLRIEFRHAYSFRYNKVYLGDRSSLYKIALEPYLPELLFAVFLMGIGLTCIVVLTVVEFIAGQTLSMTHISWGVFTVSIWIIANDGARQFFFSNVSVVRDVAYMCVCILPLPFLLYCDEVQNWKYHGQYVFLEFLGFVSSGSVVGLYMLNKRDWVDSFMIIEIQSFLYLAFVLFTIIVDLIKGRIKNYIMPAMIMMVLAVSLGTQITLFIIYPDSLYNGMVVEGGMFFALILSIISTVISLSKVNIEKTRAVMESEEKAKFMASISHEIRTPINAVLGMNELIIRETKDKKVLEYAGNIESSGNILLALINDILDFSKAEAGQLEILPVQYDTVALLRDAIALVDKRAENKDLKLVVDIDPTLPKSLRGDELKVRQVLINLLTNAVKYTDKGTVTLRVHYYYEDGVDFKLVATVSDTGIGIKEEDQRYLFESFRRVDELKNRSIEGTGLGLAITKSLLEQMKGKILVKSAYGKGSEFTVEIPQSVVDDTGIGEFEYSKVSVRREKNYKVSFRAPSARVLVVDDNSMNLAVFRGMLQDTMVQIDVAASGKDSIDMVMTNSYDAIYLDHMMPEMDGVETLKKLTELGLAAGIPVIALTANAIQGAKEMYLEAGFSDYIAKPVKGEDLEKNLAKWLPNKKIESVPLTKDELLNTSLGLQHCGYNQEFYDEMISMYINADKSNDLVNTYNSQDWENYRIHMHSIKSTSLTIGAETMSEHARLQEAAVKENDMAYVVAHHQAILKEYIELINNLKCL